MQGQKGGELPGRISSDIAESSPEIHMLGKRIVRGYAKIPGVSNTRDKNGWMILNF
jgi:hypothetical protein